MAASSTFFKPGSSRQAHRHQLHAMHWEWLTHEMSHSMASKIKLVLIKEACLAVDIKVAIGLCLRALTSLK
jgi:hypothetical protein